MIKNIIYVISFLFLSIIFYLFLIFDINNYKAELTEYVSSKTNYNFEYDGKLTLDILSPTVITIPNIEISKNIGSGKQNVIFQIAEAKLSVTLNELIKGIIDAEEIIARDFRYHGINIDDILMKTYSVIKLNRFSSLEEDVTRLKTISATAMIIHDKIIIKNIYMETELLEMNGSGTIDLSTNQTFFELTGNLKNIDKVQGVYSNLYPEDLSGEELPINITGKLDKLSVSINLNKILTNKLNPLKNDVIDKLKDKIADELKERINLPF